MRFDILTLFPDMLQGPLEASILKRAQSKGLLEVAVHDIREAATDKHRTVDDTPYGGGAGMLLKVDVLAAALRQVLEQPEVQAVPTEKRRILLLTPQGKALNQERVRWAARQYEQITLICGHYEGFDERIRALADGELSVGPFVVTGGELPALLFVDAVSRLLPSVIRQESPEEESFSLRDVTYQMLLEYPQYTRPLEFEGQAVPDVLLSGNHAAVRQWRLEQARSKTNRRKGDPDDRTI